MSSQHRGSAGAGNKVIQQLVAGSKTAAAAPAQPPDPKDGDTHVATTIIQRIANARRNYLAWLALQTSSITGKEPPIDRDADASWRAR